MVDSTLCSDYVLYMHWSGKLDPVLQDKCVAHIRRRQLPDGGWNIYEGGPSEINATVKAYFALKLAGHSPETPWMRDARAVALRLGGIPRMNTYAKLYLALLGQFPWKYLPAIPVELILLPDWLFFNIYEMSSWSRAMLMPLAILNHLKPTRQLPAEKHLHELYPAGLEHTDLSMARGEKFFSLRNFFISATEMFRVFESPGMAWLRETALERADDLDDGPHGRRLGWPGRGFPGDAQFHHGAAGAGPAGQRSAAAEGHPAISKASSWTIRRISASSPASRRSGIRPSI